MFRGELDSILRVEWVFYTKGRGREADGDLPGETFREFLAGAASFGRGGSGFELLRGEYC